MARSQPLSPEGLLPPERVAALHGRLFQLLLRVESSLDVPVAADAAAADLQRFGGFHCILVLLDEAGRQTLVGGAGVPAELRACTASIGQALLGGFEADFGYERLADCSATLTDGARVVLVAYGTASERACLLARAWLDVAMPAFFLAIRHTRDGLRLIASSVELEAEVERRTREIVRLSASERELLARLQEQTRQLQDANAELRQLDELKTAIVAGVSHELRTPISTIKALVHLLRNHDVSPDKFLHYLSVLDAQCDRQAQLIDDLLSLARLEAGGQGLDRTDQNVLAIVQQVLATMQPAFEAAGQELVAVLPDGPLPPLCAHASELEQIIGNLLSNAHKFTPSGGRVCLSLALEDGALVLAVSDNGAGIPTELLGRIFERFYRIPNTQRQIPGTGLGLAITRRLVESLGGRIAVASEVGHGSTFTVHLPQKDERHDTYSPSG